MTKQSRESNTNKAKLSAYHFHSQFNLLSNFLNFGDGMTKDSLLTPTINNITRRVKAANNVDATSLLVIMFKMASALLAAV
ncbi:hypothetical protein Q5X77_00090 [Acinetobacter baumannii]|nr:hypothetical protein [Acinetobacter baumannii]